jgi:hypothetical protein
MSNKEDVELARAWLQGKSNLFDDLADLVEGMIDKPLDAPARTFLSTIGRDAKAMASAKGNARPTPSARRPPDPPPQQPSAEPPPAPTISLDELMRRRRERERARILEQFGRYNDECWADQAQMVRPGRWRLGRN